VIGTLSLSQSNLKGCLNTFISSYSARPHPPWGDSEVRKFVGQMQVQITEYSGLVATHCASRNRRKSHVPAYPFTRRESTRPRSCITSPGILTHLLRRETPYSLVLNRTCLEICGCYYLPPSNLSCDEVERSNGSKGHGETQTHTEITTLGPCGTTREACQMPVAIGGYLLEESPDSSLHDT